MLIPGRGFFVKAFKQIRTATWGMDSLVAVSCATAFAYSLWNTLFPQLQRELGFTPYVYYEGIGAIICFLLLGRWLEGKARFKAIRGMGELLNELATVALCWKNGRWTGQAVASLQLGDRVLVQAGARIPVDGWVVAGQAEVDESWLTGEAMPVLRGIGDEVSAGSLAASGSIEVQVSRRGSETLQGQIHQQIREAQAVRAPIQDRVDQITQWFVPLVMALAVISAIIWWIFGGENAFTMGVLAFVNTLIIACPCALGLATPTALVAGVYSAVRLGVLVRDPSVWEKTGKINILLCDKTGTLTVGRPIVQSIRWSPSLNRNRRCELLKLWQKAAQHSTHPVARALIPFAESELGLDSVIGAGEPFINEPLDTAYVEEHVGLGLSFRYQNTEYRMGRRSFVENELSAPHPALLPHEINSTASEACPTGSNSELVTTRQQDDWDEWIQSQGEASAELWLGANDHLLACVLLADSLRTDAHGFVKQMKKRGVRLLIISGDTEARVALTARELGIKDYKSNLLPGQKLAEVREWQSKNLVVAVLGDGLNDAGALAAADMGMAMGAGSALSKHQSGLVVTRNELSVLGRFFDLAGRTHLILRQNLFWAFAYNAVGIPVAMGALYPFFGLLLHPSLAAAAMAFSSVSVVGNSIRLLRLRSETN
jgi:Cu2+-exporting ATPase